MERFRDFKREILRFATDWAVPFTNNEAERSIRFSKVKEKVSGCFLTKRRAEEYVEIMSYTNTAYKQCIGYFDAIKAAKTGRAFPLVAQWSSVAFRHIDERLPQPIREQSAFTLENSLFCTTQASVVEATE